MGYANMKESGLYGGEGRKAVVGVVDADGTPPTPPAVMMVRPVDFTFPEEIGAPVTYDEYPNTYILVQVLNAPTNVGDFAIGYPAGDRYHAHGPGVATCNVTVRCVQAADRPWNIFRPMDSPSSSGTSSTYGVVGASAATSIEVKGHATGTHVISFQGVQQADGSWATQGTFHVAGDYDFVVKWPGHDSVTINRAVTCGTVVDLGTIHHTYTLANHVTNDGHAGHCFGNAWDAGQQFSCTDDYGSFATTWTDGIAGLISPGFAHARLANIGGQTVRVDWRIIPNNAALTLYGMATTIGFGVTWGRWSGDLATGHYHPRTDLAGNPAPDGFANIYVDISTKDFLLRPTSWVQGVPIGPGDVSTVGGPAFNPFGSTANLTAARPWWGFPPPL
jgi:hypothetical protein